MRKLVAAFLCLGLCAGVANAQFEFTIHFYFSTSGSLDAIPAEYGVGDIPTVDPGQMAYLWAKVPETTIWNNNGLGFNLDVCGDIVGMSGEAYNFDLDYGAGIRWNPGSDFDPSDGFINPLAVTEAGLGHSLDLGQVYGSMGGTGHYLIGEFDLAAADHLSSIYLSVSSAGVARRDGLPGDDGVKFGFGDDPIANNAFGECSTIADLFVTPEPTSLLLLGLAGLALRRR